MPAILDYTGWTAGAKSMFEQAGGLASGVKLLFSGETKANRQAIKDAQAAQKEAINKAEVSSMNKNTMLIKAWAWIQENWLTVILVGVGFILLILWRPLMRFFNVKKRVKSPRRHFRSVKKSVVRVKRSKLSSGFKRKIRGKTYTSPKSWAMEMRRLRKKGGK